jgi:hypothetical protein
VNASIHVATSAKPALMLVMVFLIIRFSYAYSGKDFRLPPFIDYNQQIIAGGHKNPLAFKKKPILLIRKGFFLLEKDNLLIRSVKGDREREVGVINQLLIHRIYIHWCSRKFRKDCL